MALSGREKAASTSPLYLLRIKRDRLSCGDDYISVSVSSGHACVILSFSSISPLDMATAADGLMRGPAPLPPPHVNTACTEDCDYSEADTALNTPTSYTEFPPQTSHHHRWSLSSASSSLSRHTQIGKSHKRRTELPIGPPSSIQNTAHATPPRVSLPPSFNPSPSPEASSSLRRKHKRSQKSFDGFHSLLSLFHTKTHRSPDNNDDHSFRSNDEEHAWTNASDLFDHQEDSADSSSSHYDHGHPSTTTTTSSSTATDIDGLRLRRLQAMVSRFHDTLIIDSTTRTLTSSSSTLNNHSTHTENPSSQQPYDKTLAFCADIKSFLEGWATDRQLNLARNNVLRATNSATRRSLRNQHAKLLALHSSSTRRHLALQRSLRKSRWRNRRTHIDHNHCCSHRERIAQLEANERSTRQQLRRLETQFDDMVEDSKRALLAEINTLQISRAALEEEKLELEHTVDTVRRELESVRDELQEAKRGQERYRQRADSLQSALDALAATTTTTTPSDDQDSSQLLILYNESKAQVADLEQENERLQLAVDRLRQSMSTLEERYQTLRYNETMRERIRIKQAQQENATAERIRSLEDSQKVLQNRLKEAEKIVAEYEQRKLEMDHTECKRLESTLHHALAERDANIQSLQRQLQESERVHTEQLQRWQEQLDQEKQVYKVQISRELRQLAGDFAELEAEVESLRQRQQEDALHVRRVEEARKEVQEKSLQRQREFEEAEAALHVTISTLEQKIAKLEDDALQLYGKNLKLAHQLGQWAP